MPRRPSNRAVQSSAATDFGVFFVSGPDVPLVHARGLAGARLGWLSFGHLSSPGGCAAALPPVQLIVLQINYDPATNPLNNNEWSFPLFECIHIAMFAMSVGTIALVDLRLLGVLFKKQTPADVLKATSMWTLIGLVVVITSGMVIFTTDPLSYLYNNSFRYKLIALTVAVVFNYTIHRKVALSGQSKAMNVMVGGLSLLLWVSIVFAGIFYAFTEELHYVGGPN